jgi:hypothetical protein
MSRGAPVSASDSAERPQVAERSHYVPQFLLRRFCEPRRRLLYQLDKTTGEVTPVSPRNAAVIVGYYDVPSIALPETIEATLARIESDAAAAVSHLVDDGVVPNAEQRAVLSIFLWLMHERSPVGQGRLDAIREVGGPAVMAAGLMYPGFFPKIAKEAGIEGTEQELEELRVRMADDLTSGRVSFEWPSHVAAVEMFQHAERGGRLLGTFGWQVREASEDSAFISSDTPLTMYDPSPMFPHSGSAWQSSPSAVSILPLSPRTALALSPSYESWEVELSDAPATLHVNLRTYAWATRWVYASSAAVAHRVHDHALANPAEVERLSYRPTTLTLVHEGEPPPGVEGPRVVEFPDKRRLR